MQQTITCYSIESMLEVTHGLVIRGLTFKTREHGPSEWIIQLTGGY